MTPPIAEPCPWCGSLAGVEHVHGHGQCRTCRTNVAPCCSGDGGNDAAITLDRGHVGQTTPTLFPSLFAQLGGADCTVTTASLLFAITQRLDCDLAEARLVLEAAQRVGVVYSKKPDRHRLRDIDPPAQAD
ncbi:MAG: hypothetical protein AB8H80_02945 [Planctomycetota bacterium]